MINDINTSERKIAVPLIESKKNQLSHIEDKLKFAQQFREQLNSEQIKNLKTTNQRVASDMFYHNIANNNASDIQAFLDQINQIKTELSSEQTKDAGEALPITIERKSFPSEKLGLLLGLFLGGILSFMVSLFLEIKRTS